MVMAGSSGDLRRQIEAIQARDCSLEVKFRATSAEIDVNALAEVEAFPTDAAGCISGCDDEKLRHWSEQIDMFYHFDNENGGRAQRVWGQFLSLAFPFMMGWTLQSMLLSVLARADFHRKRGAAKFQYVEVFCGRGNLSRACIAAGLLGVSLDTCVNPDHDVLSASGFRLLLAALTGTVQRGMLWIGTPCRSFSVMSASVSRRAAENMYLGDTSLFCVQLGNVLADITGLLLLLGFFLDLSEGLEQPGGSTLPLTPVVNAVLRFVGSSRTDTYHWCFGGPTLKPLQLWSRCNFMRHLRRPKPFVPSMEENALAKRGSDGSYTGTRELLEESQAYTLQFGRCVVAALFHEWRGN